MYIRLSATRSTESAVLFGMPQGSVLGSVLLYTADLLQLVKCHDLNLHAYAVTQISGFLPSIEADVLLHSLPLSVDDTSAWMKAKPSAAQSR